MTAARALPARWLPFLILPAPDAGRSDLVELWKPDGLEWPAAFDAEHVREIRRWSFEEVVYPFVVQAASWHLLAERRRAGETPRATRAELDRWISDTRSLASRLPFRDPAVDLMRRAAESIQRTIDWPRLYFSRVPPSLDSQAAAEFRVSIHLWALEQLLRAFNEAARIFETRSTVETRGEATHPGYAPTKFWPALFADRWPWPDDPPAFANYVDAEKRVRRLQARITPGKAEALMISLLTDALHRPHRPEQNQTTH